MSQRAIDVRLGLRTRLDGIPEDDMRRQFDVNYWGTVYGALAAVPHLKKQGGP